MHMYLIYVQYEYRDKVPERQHEYITEKIAWFYRSYKLVRSRSAPLYSSMGLLPWPKEPVTTSNTSSNADDPAGPSNLATPLEAPQPAAVPIPQMSIRDDARLFVDTEHDSIIG